MDKADKKLLDRFLADSLDPDPEATDARMQKIAAQLDAKKSKPLPPIKGD